MQDPHDEGARHHELALNAIASGDLAAAMTHAQQAVAADNSNISFRETLARVHYRNGDLPAVISLYESIVQAQPQYFAAWKRLSRLWLENWQFDRAEQTIARALQLDANDGQLLAMLIYAKHEQGEAAQAKAVAGAAAKQLPSNLALAMDARLLLPMVYEHAEAIDSARAAYAKGLDELMTELPRWRQSAEQVFSLERSNFLLAYQGRDDRELQQQYAAFIGELIAAAAPALTATLPRRFDGTRKLRIGFVSKWFYASTAGSYFERWLTGLDPERFERFAYYTGQGEDALTQRIEKSCEHFSRLHMGAQENGHRILADELDVLVHTEVGMSTGSYLLSAMRLAPVQLVAWGHPVTTGSRVIDYYLSCREMEPPEFSAHYSEKVLLLGGIGVDIPLPPEAKEIARSALNLPIEAHLYFCPQSLFKIHPDMDDIFLKVLERDPRAVLVFFQAGSREITMAFANRLGDRLARAGIQAKGQMKFLPRLNGDMFRSALRLADVMLDTLHWSGGGTSLDAIAVDVPVVTLPGAFMRGQQTAAMLRLMGLEKWIASDVDDYVAKAVGLAADRTLNASVRAEIAARKSGLFGRAEAVSEFADVVYSVALKSAS